MSTQTLVRTGTVGGPVRPGAYVPLTWPVSTPASRPVREPEPPRRRAAGPGSMTARSRTAHPQDRELGAGSVSCRYKCARRRPKEEPCPPQPWYAQPTVRSLIKALAKKDR